MEKIKDNLKFIIPVIILFMIVFTIVFCYTCDDNNEDTIIKKSERVKKEEKKETKEKVEELYYFVDIKGAVNNPGVYEMKENSRVIDVISSAGGLKENADTSIINLGKKVFDEMFIVIYTKDEIDKYKDKTSSSYNIQKEIESSYISIDENNDAQIANNSSEQKNANTKKNNDLININTAKKDELLTISGIGESKAEAIIKYRKENGNFSQIEDIKNVSGIGDAVFEKIKKYITI